MALLDFFLSRNKNTTNIANANIAKERLQIIIAEQRKYNNEPDYFPQLKREILSVICKYVKIEPNMISVQLEQKREDITILELNVILPD
ncbi:cell division topological specificity factor MinE [Buchnera aphidicola]|uniref:Cell division topological specificity factor n=1 Tax=Buchnera aphidicola str. USDA (Myzus persicae) TaxID=1009856 RepID=W0P001_BUCMP|nr:cell division topological specificity factor MinE [Buchnera aphidicola]AHG60059.1 Mine [Buchnera aphidicola str. USDA (Myzus persicae)]AHG60639.1 Mine [Buchnera aphidicola str. W106 (Myzus persicae)]AHG61211.1 Mine [Buchnera aphidicola str. G002 (Myzus persicae)]AHG61784.1 Mine [Buchnera aphidicola str. F009 (Myzus persicae)]WAI03256.1 MAG: cell division topological specificity factor MinE [Buchnera aphidicola (Myzus persicae)]